MRLRRRLRRSCVYHADAVHLFHYHLVTAKVREVEARYVGKLGFHLVARHGRIGEDLTSYESGMSWSELDVSGFKLRLSELERGAVNRSEEHTSELQSRQYLVCRLLLEKKKKNTNK